MNEIDFIKKKLNGVRIVLGQLDPNGICNVKCWYCPVSEFGNPKKYIHNMSLEQIEHILIEIKNSKLFSRNFNTILPFHYNEVLLYKDYEGMVDLFRKYGLHSNIATNGTTLTPEKTDFYIKNKDILGQINCNCPTINEDDWIKQTGMTKKLYDTLIKNFDYFHEQCQENDMRIVLNNVNDRTKNCSTMDNGLSSDFYDICKIEFEIKQKYPKFHVQHNDNLVDRAGLLKERNKLKNKIRDYPVNNCNYMGMSRTYEFFHINSLGDMFLCCNDFNMDYKFGNIFEQSFDEIWLSDKHAEVIHQAHNTICKKCVGGEYIINEKI